MGYSHTGRRSRLLWDGSESGIINNTFEYVCPICNKSGQFSFKDAVELSSLSDRLCNFLKDENIVLLNQANYEIKKGVQAYGINLSCDGCNGELWLIVGIKEVQPQRYNCYLKSVICEKKGGIC